MSLCLRTEISQVFLQLYNSHPYCSLPFLFPNLFFFKSLTPAVHVFPLCWNWKFRGSSSGRNPLPQAPIMLWQGPFPKSKLCYGEGSGHSSQCFFLPSLQPPIRWQGNMLRSSCRNLVGFLEDKSMEVGESLKTVSQWNSSLSCWFTFSLPQFIKITI